MNKNKKFVRFLTVFLAILLCFNLFVGGLIAGRLFNWPLIDRFLPRKAPSANIVEQKILDEESTVIAAIEKASPAVVTVGINKTQTIRTFNPFDPFSFLSPKIKKQEIKQDIGSGFIVDKNGLVITNKHVVADQEAQYRVITSDNKTFPVKKIYRDPTNDLAILKIEGENLPVVTLGDSSSLKVGQMAIAIGTALGEFRHTVTVGVISGLGRGITAGSPFEGYAEQLDNIIQTDAAINPGNSGGPLINSLGQVIGVNVAVAEGAENIGFALPINAVKDTLRNFKETGEFARPFLGVRYAMISQEAALLNEVPEGAYITEVMPGSPAEKGGLKKGDIITKINDEKVKDVKGGLAAIIARKKAGQEIKVNVWRDEKELTLKIKLETAD